MTPENKQISINGKFISGYKHITIAQKINDHHSFEVGIDLEAGETTTAHTIDKSKDWLGKTILITTTGKDFTGIITNVSLNQNNGNHGQIILSGYSSTIVLEDSELMQSWLNKSLADIVKVVTKNPKLTTEIAPENTATLDYESQYLETNFKFIQRIAKQHNEWLFYDGDTLFFGKPSQTDPITIEYGKDLTEMNIGIQAQARKAQAFSYNSQDVQQHNSQTPDSPAGLNELGQHAFNTSLELFSTGGNGYTIPRIKNKSEIDNYLKKKQQSAAANSNYISGKSTKKGLAVGSIIDIETAILSGVASYATKKHGKYIITEITHYAKEANYYTNSFVALPVDIKSLPEPDVAIPVAQTQMATVLSNQDPKNKGRVQVQMNWQTGEMKTAWIRVMTPDAGSSSNVATNRGFVFIPEEGDQVLLGFRYNDPNRPFVLGSLFNGQTGAGG
ncbi:phage baseplate assembly protein V, partial [Cellulophaga sp. 20_2_10]|uniref:phage baseplate assembly protein V n=1 Tax=Cellulophaga sp. 20_2_10 TaxID=2942476 RepID=UPI00201B0AAA